MLHGILPSTTVRIYIRCTLYSVPRIRVNPGSRDSLESCIQDKANNFPSVEGQMGTPPPNFSSPSPTGNHDSLSSTLVRQQTLLALISVLFLVRFRDKRWKEMP